MTEFLQLFEGEQLKVMVVSDLRVNRVLICKVLNGSGFQTVEADGPSSALKELSSGNPLPNLIVTDWGIPRESGFEFAKKLKGAIPVILLAGNTPEGFPDLASAERAAFDAGIEGFMKKPLDIPAFERLVRACID